METGRIYTYIPLFLLRKYRSVYESNRLFRKPPLLGPRLSCAKILWQPRAERRGGRRY